MNALNATITNYTNNYTGIELRQSSHNDWGIYFTDGMVPKGTYDKATKKWANLKSGYTINIDVWAEGTYDGFDALGNPVPLKYKNSLGKWITTTKPFTVKVKVVVK